MEQLSGFPQIAADFDFIPDADIPQFELKREESQGVSQCFVKVLFAFDGDTKSEVLFPEVQSKSILVHGSVPKFKDSLDDSK